MVLGSDSQDHSLSYALSQAPTAGEVTLHGNTFTYTAPSHLDEPVDDHFLIAITNGLATTLHPETIHLV